MNYNLIKTDIEVLSDIDLNNTTKYYRFKETDFFFKKHDNTDRLVVSFHGSRETTKGIYAPLPIFRGFDWDFNMLCISDKLLNIVDVNVSHIGWFLSPNGSGFHETYVDIISFFLDKFQNIVFTGTSAGGFPALLYSSYFKKKGIISNTQLYLNNAWPANMVNNMEINLNKQFEIKTCEDIITKFGCPKKFIYYTNENDIFCYKKHFCPFNEYLTKNNYNTHFDMRNFIGKETAYPHAVQIPAGTTYHDEIEKLLNFNPICESVPPQE